MGAAGSRSTTLHVEPSRTDAAFVRAATGADLLDLYHGRSSALPRSLDPIADFEDASPEQRETHADAQGGPGKKPSTAKEPSLRYHELRRFALLRWMGTVGSLLLGLGALGAGALPVRENAYSSYPLGSIMGRMLQTSTMICFVGVGLLVLAWLLMAPFTGALLRPNQRPPALISLAMLWRTFAAWSLPILASAPMFTQDIYSYLANGKIVRLGLDPYSAGPVDLLGPSDVLSRSVPFIWAHSPSPYGPVALGLARIISEVTGDGILWGVTMHRALSIAGVIAAGWALFHLSRRCGVIPQAAFWLGVLNPITMLHLIGGIHNEAVLLGLVLVGVELGLRACTAFSVHYYPMACGYLLASGLCISCAGMVKVTGFLALGFVGMAVARTLHQSGRSRVVALAVAVAVQLVLLLASVALLTWVTGIPTGWIHGQGGAVTIRSWMSLTTAIGVLTGGLGMLLGLGDHTEAVLTITRGAGAAVAGLFMLRMLLATFRGTISAIGGLGVATFVLVVLFPVVHPWYMLWAILPLAAWANRPMFRWVVAGYSVVMSFFVLPRGLSLPPSTVAGIYLGSALAFVLTLAVCWWVILHRRVKGLH